MDAAVGRRLRPGDARLHDPEDLGLRAERAVRPAVRAEFYAKGEMERLRTMFRATASCGIRIALLAGRRDESCSRNR